MWFPGAVPPPYLDGERHGSRAITPLRVRFVCALPPTACSGRNGRASTAAAEGGCGGNATPAACCRRAARGRCCACDSCVPYCLQLPVMDPLPAALRLLVEMEHSSEDEKENERRDSHLDWQPIPDAADGILWLGVWEYVFCLWPKGYSVGNCFWA